MNDFLKSAFAATLALILSSAAVAKGNLDALLSQIDADIAATRLSSPAGNNAIERIYEFKSLAPYDQRINSRVYKVGEFYVKLANKAIAAKQYQKGQNFLDKAWMLAYLTPGLEAAQDKLDAVYRNNSSVAQAAPPVSPKPAAPPKAEPKPKAVAKTSNKEKEKAKQEALAKKKAAEAQRKKQLAAEKAAAAEAKKLAEQKAKEAEALKRKLAEQEKEAEAKREAAAKLALMKAQQNKAKDLLDVKETSKAIAEFSLDQLVIDERSSREIRKLLEPICQEILDNEASVVLHTRTPQDYRWLTVRLTLCVRRLDRDYRLRHSNQLVENDKPVITLHPSRSMALMNREDGL